MSLASGVAALATRIAEEVNTVRGETATGLAGKAASTHTHAEGDVTSLTTDLAGKAAVSHVHAAADVSSGTLAIARVPTGTSSSTVCIGNDGRLSDTRTPTAGSVTDATVAVAAAIAESKLSLASDAAAATASRRTLGTGSTQAAAGNHTHAAADVASGTLAIARIPTGMTSSTVAIGNDSRLSDTRTPTDATVTDAKVSATAAIAETKLSLASDAAAGTASRRTLGTGATQAAAGTHTHADPAPSTSSSGAATWTVDATTNSTFARTATGNIVIAAPTGMVDGQRIWLEVYASGGARTVSFSGLTFTAGLATSLAPATGKVAVVGIYYSSRAGHPIVTAFNVEL